MVYDYADGKLDWMGAGLPTEGTNNSRPRAAGVARPDVPTCRLDEKLGEVRKRVTAAGWDTCVVVDETGVVFGLLREDELKREAGLTIEQAMRPGPSTFRPFVPIAEMAQYMTEHNLLNAPITTSDGRLLGLLRREDAVKAAQGSDPKDSAGKEQEQP